MKKEFTCKVVALMMLLSLVITGCDDDSNPVEPALGTFKFDNTDYSLTGGYVIQTSQLIDPKRYEVGFFTEGLSLSIIKDGTTNKLIGSALLITITSTKENELEVGTYNIDGGWVITEGDWSSEQDLRDNQSIIEKGTVTVAKTSDQYTVTYNLETDDAKTVTGSFIGGLAE